MHKKNYSLQMIASKDSKLQRSGFFSLCDNYDCPECKEHSFEINQQYQIGYCKNCNIFVDFFRGRQRNVSMSKQELSLMSIYNDAKTHLDEETALLELQLYGIMKQQAEQSLVGYYPPLYWIDNAEDGVQGNMIIVMKDFYGKVTNICAKHAGSPEFLSNDSIHFANPYMFGCVNERGIWNEEVNLFLDPMDCLCAMHNGVPNSIYMNQIIFPEIIVFDRLNIFGNGHEFDYIKSLPQIMVLSDKIFYYKPEHFKVKYFYQYFTSVQIDKVAN